MKFSSAFRIVFLVVASFAAAMAQNSVDSDTLEIKLKPFAPENKFLTPGWHNWGGSIIQGDDGVFRLFYSRWPVENSFYAWLTHSEIAVATSPNASGPWTYEYTALENRDVGWDEITAHNPKIKKFDGKYYLYYIATSGGFNEAELKEIARAGGSDRRWPILRNRQLTGVAQSDSLTGPFTRNEEPILAIGPPLHNLVVNPAITRGPDGRYVLMVKGDRAAGGGQRIQAVATGPSPLGPFELQPEPAIKDFDTEDASIWYDQDRSRFYAIFHAHTYYGMITSINGTDWKKANFFNLGSKSFRQQGGGVFATHRMERPNVWIGPLGVPEVFSSSFTDGANQSGILTIPIADPAAYEGAFRSDFDPALTVSSEARWHKGEDFSQLVTGPANAPFAFHTVPEVRPWVQLDFGNPTHIDSILVQNRSDELQSRARHLALEVSDDGEAWNTVWQADGSIVNQWTINLTHQQEGEEQPGVTARYMRFYLDQTQAEALHLKRIQPKAKLAKDSDGDGIDDAWEMSHFSDLNTATADSDYDGDGVSDLDELRAGTDPKNPHDFLQVFSHDLAPTGSQLLVFSSVHTRRYAIEASSDLKHWSPIAGLEGFAPDGHGRTSRSVAHSHRGSQEFYRIVATR